MQRITADRVTGTLELLYEVAGRIDPHGNDLTAGIAFDIKPERIIGGAARPRPEHRRQHPLNPRKHRVAV